MDSESGAPEGRLFDEQMVAQRLCCSVALLRKWRLFKRGPAYVRVGRLIRYSEADLDAFITNNRVEGK